MPGCRCFQCRFTYWLILPGIVLSTDITGPSGGLTSSEKERYGPMLTLPEAASSTVIWNSSLGSRRLSSLIVLSLSSIQLTDGIILFASTYEMTTGLILAEEGLKSTALPAWGMPPRKEISLS